MNHTQLSYAETSPQHACYRHVHGLKLRIPQRVHAEPTSVGSTSGPQLSRGPSRRLPRLRVLLLNAIALVLDQSAPPGAPWLVENTRRDCPRHICSRTRKYRGEGIREYPDIGAEDANQDATRIPRSRGCRTNTTGMPLGCLPQPATSELHVSFTTVWIRLTWGSAPYARTRNKLSATG